MSSKPNHTDMNGPKDKTEDDAAAAEAEEEEEEEEWSDAATVQMPAISDDDPRTGD